MSVPRLPVPRFLHVPDPQTLNPEPFVTRHCWPTPHGRGEVHQQRQSLKPQPQIYSSLTAGISAALDLKGFVFAGFVSVGRSRLHIESRVEDIGLRCSGSMSQRL